MHWYLHIDIAYRRRQSVELPKAFSKSYFVLVQGQGAFIDMGFCIVNSLYFKFLEAYARLTK